MTDGGATASGCMGQHGVRGDAAAACIAFRCCSGGEDGVDDVAHSDDEEEAVGDAGVQAMWSSSVAPTDDPAAEAASVAPEPAEGS